MSLPRRPARFSLERLEPRDCPSLTVSLFNGTLTVGPAPGGQLLWTSGNGNDSLTLGDANTLAGSTWNVRLTFGTGNDTLTLSDAALATQFISGFVDLGGPPRRQHLQPGRQLDHGPALDDPERLAGAARPGRRHPSGPTAARLPATTAIAVIAASIWANW
jgi:hypothetical protein